MFRNSRQRVSPTWLLSCVWACSQSGRAWLKRSRPALDSDSSRSRRSLPRRSAIHCSRPIMRSVRVSVVESMARICPNRPWDASPVKSSAWRMVNCVARSPAGRSASSYTCVSARVARRKLAHKQGKFGSCGKETLTKDRCIYIYLRFNLNRETDLAISQSVFISRISKGKTRWELR